jgi:hypothetical protein
MDKILITRSMIGTTICVLDAAAMPAASFVTKFAVSSSPCRGRRRPIRQRWLTLTAVH